VNGVARPELVDLAEVSKVDTVLEGELGEGVGWEELLMRKSTRSRSV
jgi:hypothetical protein